MNVPTSWGGGHPMSFGGGHPMDIPLVPAPMVFFAMLFGVMIGVMIGRQKSMMHDMGPGMHHGWGDWEQRKKMMGMMASHHHHGEGTPACRCDEAAATDEGPKAE
jgi:hypothetical protein